MEWLLVGLALALAMRSTPIEDMLPRQTQQTSKGEKVLVVGVFVLLVLCIVVAWLFPNTR